MVVLVVLKTDNQEMITKKFRKKGFEKMTIEIKLWIVDLILLVKSVLTTILKTVRLCSLKQRYQLVKSLLTTILKTVRLCSLKQRY